jgi:hypothetical protein
VTDPDRATGAVLSSEGLQAAGDTAMNLDAPGWVCRIIWQGAKRLKELEDELAELRKVAHGVCDTPVYKDEWVDAMNALHHVLYPARQVPTSDD